jgi:hypothetical protein
MLDGRRILQAAPVHEQTEAFWTKCKTALSELIAAGLVYKNESERLLEFKHNGGRIRTKTAWNADTLRGDYADELILEEFSLMDPDAWEEVGAPMLLDNDGNATFIFTPKRRNHAFKLYMRAKNDTTGRWAAWQFTSHDNPHLSKEALAEIVEDMGEDAYKQEILAEFLEGEGQVFRNIEACLTAPLKATPGQHRGHVMMLGCDWAKHNDFTSISIVCATCKAEVELQRFNKIDYLYQSERLKDAVKRWGVKTGLAESNSIGEPILERLVAEHVPLTGFQTTAATKPPLIESLALAFERAEMRWLPDAVARTELEAYERKISAVAGRSSYSAPQGVHDDTVIARALAWKAIQDGIRSWSRGPAK